MTPAEARLFAQSLLEAADQAEAEGRDLAEADLDTFLASAATAADELAAAIERRQGD